MRLTTFAALASFVASAVAHATVWGVWVNGVDQGDGRNQYVRKIPFFSTPVSADLDAPFNQIRSPRNNSPIKDLNSSDLSCNANNRGQASHVLISLRLRLTSLESGAKDHFGEGGR